MIISKAIIPVAGWGTRMLPITKAIEKCMLPIGTRPVIDYVVQDVIAAGVTDIYFVVGEQSTQIQNFYRSNIQLNDYLRRQGKEDKLPLVAPLSGVNIHFITQPSTGKYGTAVPVGLVDEYIDEGESVLVLMGDDFFYDQGITNEVARLVEAAVEGDAAMIAINIPKENVSKYGVLQLDEKGKYVNLVEKPTVEDAPSTLINPSKYLLTKEMVHHAASIEINSKRGEYEIVDVLNEFVDNGGVVNVIEARSKYLDCGSVDGWLEANNTVLNQERI